MFHITTGRPDNTKDWIKEKSNDLPPVESPFSRTVELISLFKSTVFKPPPPESDVFPLRVEDPRMTKRLKEILNYLVEDRTVSEWICTFEELIGINHIEAVYVVGSSTTYVAGQALLREALSILSQRIPSTDPNKMKLIAKMYGKISKKTYSYSDVDIRIKLKPGYVLSDLQNKLKCKSDLFYGTSLLVQIGKGDKNSLDLCIHTGELKVDAAANLDDFKIDVKKCDINLNRIVFKSNFPWMWFEGQVLGLHVDYTTDKYRSFLRLLWQLSKGRISLIKSDSEAFPIWFKKITGLLKANEFDEEAQPTAKQKNALEAQFSKQKNSHDRDIPFSDLLIRLQTQQIVRTHSLCSAEECPEKTDIKVYSQANYSRILRETSKTEIHDSFPPFLKAIFKVMQKKGSDVMAIHQLIECLANLGLFEAWKKPFQVKLVWHEGVLTQRICFTGTFGKRYLYVRFDIAASNTFIHKVTQEQWKKMRGIIYSLWFEGISQRDLGKNYRSKFSKTFDPIQIKRKILSLTGHLHNEIPLALCPSLPMKEIDWNQDAAILLEIGKLVFKFYQQNQELRSRLCWRIVSKCFHHACYSTATELIQMLRKASLDPEEGYPALFAKAVKSGCSSYLLYEACSPFPPFPPDRKDPWEPLCKSTSKAISVVTLMNEIGISAELFLEMTQLLHVKNPEILNETLLLKLIQHDTQRACQWIKEKDKETFKDNSYKEEVSQHILNNMRYFETSWIANYILSGRFNGKEEDKIVIGNYLIKKPLKVQSKAKLLEILQIQDEKLWQAVASEYIGLKQAWPQRYDAYSKIKGETIVLWMEVLECAGEDELMGEKLRKIEKEDPLEKSPFREHIFVKILKNWSSERRVEPSLLKKLALTKNFVPWDLITQEATSGEDILKNIYTHACKVEKQPVLKTLLYYYSSLYRELKPEGQFFSTYWINLVLKTIPRDELLTILQKPLMTECFQIRTPSTFSLLRPLIKCKEGMQFALFVLDELDLEMMSELIAACSALDDFGQSGGQVFLKFYRSQVHKKIKCLNHLGDIAKRILMDPKGDTEAAARMWELAKKLAIPNEIPKKEHLLYLLRYYPDYVYEIIIANVHNLEAVDTSVFCKLIKSIDDLDKRCVILMGCPHISEATQRLWEMVVQTDHIDPFSAAKLITVAKKLKVTDSKVQKFVLSHIQSVVLEDQVLKYLLEMTSRIDSQNARILWEALEKSKKVDKKELWTAGYVILKKNPHIMHYNLLKWLISNTKSDVSEKLLELLEEALKYTEDDKFCSLVFPFIKCEMLKNSESAKRIYTKLDSDENITIDDLNILKPDKENCLKIIRRLMSKESEERYNEEIFSSIFCVWIKYKELDTNTDEHLKINKLLYQMLSEYISNMEDKECLIWISRLFHPVNLDIAYMKDHPPFQTLCKKVIKNEQSLPLKEKYFFLNNLVANDFLLEHASPIIKTVGCSGLEDYFKISIQAISKIYNGEIPAKLIFQCHKFPQYIPSVESIISKNVNPGRRNYLNGILSSVIVIKNPSKESIDQFITLLKPTLEYFEFHFKSEKQDWLDTEQEINKYYNFPGEEVSRLLEGLSTHTRTFNFVPKKPLSLRSELISNYITRSIFKSDFQLFLSSETMNFFIDNVLASQDINIYILVMISFECLKSGNYEMAVIFCNVLFKFLKANCLTKKLSTIGFMLLSCAAGEMMVKFKVNNPPMLELCLSIIDECSKSSTLNQEIILRGHTTYMILKGAMPIFQNCTPNEMALSIAQAIQSLCDSPDPINLNKAQKLLIEATREILFLFPQCLREANNRFVKESIRKMHPGNISSLIPQLFLHLIDPNNLVDCFSMSRDQINTHLKRLLSKTGYKLFLLQLNDEDLDAIEATRYELITSNVKLIREAFPNYMHCTIGIVNASVLTLLAEKFKLRPDCTIKFMREIYEGCKKWDANPDNKDQQCIKSAAVLLCSQSFTPCESWEAYFSEAKLSSLYEAILLGRAYCKPLQEVGRQREMLLSLRPDLYQAKLSLTEDDYDKEIAIRFQWLRTSILVNIYSPIDQETIHWMSPIQDEFIKCLKLLPTTPHLKELSINILFLLQKVIEFNAKLAKTNPEFANYWHRSLIQNLMKNFTNVSNLWFLELIDDKFQSMITLELIPSLPDIEKFSAFLSTEHQKRNCIDALYQLIFLGCMDDTIVQKAVANLEHTYSKIRSSITENGLAICQYLPDPEFNFKFTCIYQAGLIRIIRILKIDQNFAKFIKNLLIFRSYSDEMLKHIENKNKFFILVFKIFENELSCFTDREVCTQIVDLMSHICELPISPHGIKPLTESKNCYLNMMIFLGPESDQNLSNKYLTEFLIEIAILNKGINLREFNHTDTLVVLIKSGVIFKHLHSNTEIYTILHNRTKFDLSFRNLYILTLKSLSQELTKLEEVRPALKKWYNSLKTAVELEKALITVKKTIIE